MAMNMRKWGSFAGGIAGGLTSGLKTGDMLANSKQARAGAEWDLGQKKKKAALDDVYYKNLQDLIRGGSLSDYYQNMGQALGMQSPQQTQPADPLTTMQDAGPGLAEY